MRTAPLVPKVHLFVCANRRPEGSSLGRGCGDAGEAVFAAMKQEVARRGAYRAVWVTQTQCLGICPATGCTVAIYPAQRVVAEVTAADARDVFETAVGEKTS